MLRVSITLLFIILSSTVAAQIKVLVVEDHALIQEDTVEILEEWGYNVKSAMDVKEAVSVWKSFQPDVVLLDMGMPLDFHGGEYDELSNGGLKVLEQAPKDKAKVVLTSSNFDSQFIRSISKFIDYNFKGKLVMRSSADLNSLKYFIDSSVSSDFLPKRLGIKQSSAPKISETIGAKKNSLLARCLSIFK